MPARSASTAPPLCPSLCVLRAYRSAVAPKASPASSEFRSAVATALIDNRVPRRSADLLAGAVALHQLDLQQVERLDIGHRTDRRVQRGMLSSSRPAA